MQSKSMLTPRPLDPGSPLFMIIHRVLLKIRVSVAWVLVLPQWHRQLWFPLLLHLLVDLMVDRPPSGPGLPGQGQGASPEDPGPSPDCMETIKNILRAQGIHENIASLATSATRPTTLCTYKFLACQVLGRGCADHETFPSEASVVQV